MVNRHRGEISAELDGNRFTLCLTLGALASLEDSLGAANLAELSNRFSDGTLGALDLIRIITAGLNGGGHEVSEDDVASMKVKGGVSGFVDIAAELLTATFVPEHDANG